MALMIIPAATYYSGAGSGAAADGHSHSNLATLNKLSINANGNLTFNGKVVGEAPIESVFSVTLNQQHLSQKFIELPNDCDSSQAITLSLNGIALAKGDFWEVVEKSYPQSDLIAWNGLELQQLAQLGDSIIISFYRRYSNS